MADSPVAFPLLGPTVSGTEITVDEALQNPTRITRDIAQLAAQRYYMGNVFTAAGGVTGGAVLFERPNPIDTDLFALRDPKPVAPANEFPLTAFARGVPMVAWPQKIGAKFYITREAAKRNDTNLLRRYMVQESNTINRRLEILALAELNAVITAETRYSDGTDWSAVAALTADTKRFNQGPLADVLALKMTIDAEERGIVLDSVILNPQEELQILMIYGRSASEVLGSVGIRTVIVSHRHPRGVATFFSRGQLGEMRLEFPLMEESWYEREIQSTWYQWSISPMFFVVNQFAVWQLRRLAGV